MQKEVFLPSLGDDDDAVRGGTISAWLAEVGDLLNEGDDLLEITTDKAAFVVPAPFAGRLCMKKVQEEEEVRVGGLLCLFEVDAD